VDYTRFQEIEDPQPLLEEEIDYLAPEDAVNKAYMAEMVKDSPTDKLREMKIKMAMEAYERRRPRDKTMHHYVVKDAGDIDAIGEYYPTGEERNSCPVYKNARGVTLTREKQPSTQMDSEEQYGWILGNIEERRPLYGVMSDDLSVPTLGWQGFTAPEPVPTVRYYNHAAAARMFKDKGNAAVQAKDFIAAESWYVKALSTGMDSNEFPEPMAMIHSNLSQVRLTLQKYDQAADDANVALGFMRDIVQTDPATVMLKQKTFVRRARALAGAKQFVEAESVMKNARMEFPDSDDIYKVLKEMTVAKQSASEARGGSAPVLRYLGQLVQEMQLYVGEFADNLADAVLPAPLTKMLLKLEYLFSKADGEVLADVQMLFRANGGLRTLLHIVKVQWKNNLDGCIADMHKLESLCTVLSIMSIACADCPESIALAASDAPTFFAALGACNRKVDAGICTRLLMLVSQVWTTCNFAAKEAVQPCSTVVERVAAFLSKVILKEPSDKGHVGGSDAPFLSETVRNTAFILLSSLASQGGRVEKRAVRGAAPMLASFDGTGFLTSDERKHRDLGELFLEKVIKEPVILSAIDVTNLLIGTQLLLLYGVGDKPVACITLEGVGVAQCADIEQIGTEDARYAARMLEAVASALHHRLVVNNQEISKSDFEAAFVAGHGWAACIPLVQGPEAFAKAALSCMSSMPSVPACAVPALGGLLGFPTPDDYPAISQAKDTLASSAAVRASAAKLLSKSVTTEGFMIFLRRDGEKSVAELTKLTTRISLDGKSNLEALHDMLYVFYQISQSVPEPLCKYVAGPMMDMLVGLSQAPVEDAAVFYAKGILNSLKLNHRCKKVIQSIESRPPWYDADILKAN